MSNLRQGFNLPNRAIQQQTQQTQSSKQEAQQIYQFKPASIQSQQQRQNNFQQNQQTSFQLQNQVQYNEKQKNYNYQTQNNDIQKMSLQTQTQTNVQQNQFQQQPQNSNYYQQFQQNQLPQNNSNPNFQNDRSRNGQQPNVNNQNQTQIRSDSSKPFDKPKRGHSIKDRNTEQQKNQNTIQAQAQEQYQLINNTFDSSQKTKAYQNLVNSKINTNKLPIINSGQNAKNSPMQNTNQQPQANNIFNIDKGKQIPFLRNNQQNQQNLNSYQQGIKMDSNIMPQANQYNFQQNNYSQPNNSQAIIPQYPQNTIQNNIINSNLANQQLNNNQNTQPFSNSYLLQQQNYMEQSQQSNLNQMNNIYQMNQLQQQYQQQQQQQQQQPQYRNLPIQAELNKKKENSQLDDLTQSQSNQQPQGMNLSVIQELKDSEISQSQSSQIQNQDQFSQQYPLKDAANSQIIETNKINQYQQNEQTSKVNLNNIEQQSNHQTQQFEPISIQNNTINIQNNFNQNFYKTNQQKIANGQTNFNFQKQKNDEIQQIFNHPQNQNKQQRSEGYNQPKDTSYEKQDLPQKSQVKIIGENNIPLQSQQEEKKFNTYLNSSTTEQSSNFKNDQKDDETQKTTHGKSKDTFQFLTKQQFDSDNNIIQILAEKVISQETQQNIQKLYQEVNTKDLGQIYNLEVLKNAIDTSIQEFNSTINSSIKGISNLKFFDNQKILDQYQLPSEIYEQCFKELQLIHTGILSELFRPDQLYQVFETKINKEFVKNMLLQYLHYFQTGEIIDCIHFNCVSMQKLTQDKLNNYKYYQIQGQYFENNLIQSFNSCLYQIKEEIQRDLQKGIADLNSENKGLDSLKSTFINKKNELINLINQYWKLIKIKNIYEIDTLSVVIIYKKIQIMNEQLNQFLEQSQDSLNSVVNEILFKQANTAANLGPIETEMSEYFLMYIRNDTDDTILQLKTKQDQLFEIACCQYEQTVVANYYLKQRAQDILENLKTIKIYSNQLSNMALDNLKKLFQKESFLSLFKSVLSENEDWSQLENINDPILLIFLIRHILKRIIIQTKKVEDLLKQINNQMQLTKGDSIDYYFNSNQNLPFFKVKFVSKLPLYIEDDTVYAIININLGLQDFFFKLSNYSQLFQYKINDQFIKCGLKDEIEQRVKQFEIERKYLPQFLFQLEKSHKCGILAMYIEEKFETIQSYLAKKQQKSILKGFINKFKKESKFEPFISQMSFTYYQKTLEYTYQLTQVFKEILKVANQELLNQKEKINRQLQSEFKQFAQKQNQYQDELIIFQDQNKIPQIVAYKDKKKQYQTLFFLTKKESFKNEEGDIVKAYKLIFEYKFQKILFFSLFSDILKEDNQLTKYFFLFLLNQILNIQEVEKQQLPVDFNEWFLKFLIENTNEQIYQLLNQKDQQIPQSKGQFQQSLQKNFEQKQTVTKTVQKEIDDQNYINQKKQDFQVEVQTNSVQLGFQVQIQDQPQFNNKKETDQSQEYKQYCLKNFLGLIQEESFKKIFNGVKKFNLDYLKDYGYVSEIRDIKDSQQKNKIIQFFKDKSHIYIIGNIYQQFQILIYLNQKCYCFYEENPPSFLQNLQIESYIKIKLNTDNNIFEQDQALTILYLLIWLQDQQSGKITQQTYDQNKNGYKFQLHLKYIWIQQQKSEKRLFQQDKILIYEYFSQIKQPKSYEVQIYKVKQLSPQNEIPLIFVLRDTIKYQKEIVFIYDSNNEQCQKDTEDIKKKFFQCKFSSIQYQFKNAQQQKCLINVSLHQYLNQTNYQNNSLNTIVNSYFTNYLQDICFPFFIQ
ncbi:hypothetical protein TTHERM_00771960 (macronuclear) [Tetrahymena thermophila SB210]|uniref:Uncharacterized protein n=1 Tax=Tetrahymena thermophila (strain SB210) TaxID=312017 RepID=Q23AQ2_TETTS|nr:hypothetical protein TTHERM_00771960 [Tetrahymena thermophila SB210]EAR93640.2 hypothetical protein TTHERM_00771960 [Tetrahymena thermophila SB210]|eukprot:XP_001013885.2 hypothetical protein TTHERM_00771960 [Tetrahymena thermophila SB210]